MSKLEETQKKGRGRSKLAVTARDKRVQISLNQEAHAALLAHQKRLEGEFGFTPTIAQTVLYLAANTKP